MPKYNRHFHGDPIQVLERLDQEIRKSTYTISLVEESQTELSGVSCVLRLYEAPGGHDHCPDDRWARIMPFCRGERWQTGADLLVSCTS